MTVPAPLDAPPDKRELCDSIAPERAQLAALGSDRLAIAHADRLERDRWERTVRAFDDNP